MSVGEVGGVDDDVHPGPQEVRHGRALGGRHRVFLLGIESAMGVEQHRPQVAPASRPNGGWKLGSDSIHQPDR
ncbi:hypothetical protein [Prescottella agglutinans]|uniref:hypothetical protein n=1 Tax=Prescottella agglutinans TaxID=1644129 RepID=UPI002474DA43|nr:hypothetical protein [Prescottella agglutinans]